MQNSRIQWNANFNEKKEIKFLNSWKSKFEISDTYDIYFLKVG